MATCPIESLITTIPPDECIGNSLTRLNDNFRDLKKQSCENYSRLEVIDANILNLQTLYSSLSTIVVPGAAKAWVKFDGTRDLNLDVNEFLTQRHIYSAYNVREVLKNKVGDYTIFFQDRFPDRFYVVAGTSSEALTLGGNYTWLQPYFYAVDFVRVRVHSNTLTDTVDPQHVSIIIY